MQRVLAIDAGGTSTRAAIIDTTGHCHGFGQASSGNPIAVGTEAATAALVAATRNAVADEGLATAEPFSLALIAMAGGTTRTATESIAEALNLVGLSGPVLIESDLLAMFHSGTLSPNGYAMISGTGAVAARILDSRLENVTDGVGWLLGDEGSGYWIGHQVALAVAAALDGRGPKTTLTQKLLQAMNLSHTDERRSGRPVVLLQLIQAVYAMRPIELARFSPLAFQTEDDPVANDILLRAAQGLLNTIAAVRNPAELSSPIVLGGGVLSRENLATATPFADTFKAALDGANVLHVSDGAVGAAILALLRSGHTVDDQIFRTISETLAARRKAPVSTHSETSQ